MAQAQIPNLSLGKNTTPVLVVLLVIAAFLIGTLWTKVSYLEKGGTTAPLGANQAAPTPAPGQKVDVEVGKLPVLGNKDAKVKLIEFSDLQCPFCKSFLDNTFPQIKKEYIDTGKVAFYFRHYPLTQIHPNANKAGVAAECANEQDKFWTYHDNIFAKQSEWSNLDNASAVSKFKSYAIELGLNASQFNSCLDSDKYQANVDQDLSDGTKAGVTGTPTTFVNGVPLVGAQPFDAFKTAIDAELAK
jgi:protein-disulfide isomerase